MHTGQRQDTPHGTEEIRQAPDDRFKDREIPERWFSDDAYDENWREYVGYDPTHLPVEEGPEPGSEQMTRMGIELPAHRSSMLCFVLPEDVARAVEEQVREVVGDEAESWNKLHVTLCVFDTPPDQDGADLVAEVARKVCAEYGPVSLRFTGVAQFESSDGVFPTVATVTGNGLAALRTDLVRAMEDAGIPVRSEYDLLPHATLAYLSDQGLALSPPAAEWTADALDVAMADGTVQQVPLPGEPRTAQDARRDAQIESWPQPVCVVCGAPAGAEQPCATCQRHHRRILEMRPELSGERAWEVLHKIHKDVGEKLEREQTGRTAQADDWWSGATYQQQVDYLKQHPKIRKKPTKGKDPREEKAEPGTIEPAPSSVKVTQQDVEGWRKDMRQMTKLYKELVAAIPEPAMTWRMEPEERAARQLLATLGIEADWWSEMSPGQQQQYAKEHPGTKKKPGGPAGEPEPGKATPPAPPDYAALPSEFPERVPPGGELDVDPLQLPPGADLKQYKLRIEGENAEEVAAALEASIKESANLCNISPPICEQNLGIPRDEMPQLSDEEIPKFLDSLAAQGVKIETGVAHVGELKATQSQLDTANMKGMIDGFAEGKYDPSESPIIVSKDGYVLDGHHRWGALLLMNPDNQMKVRKVDMGIQDLLKAADPFSGAKKKLSRLLASLGLDAYTDERGWERNSDGQREHRRVMEEKLDRPLNKSEDVHHKNEDKGDNRPENLEVIDHAEHTREHKTEASLLASLGVDAADTDWPLMPLTFRSLARRAQAESEWDIECKRCGYSGFASESPGIRSCAKIFLREFFWRNPPPIDFDTIREAPRGCPQCGDLGKLFSKSRSARLLAALGSTAQAEIACDTCGIEIPYGEEVVVGDRLKSGKRFYHRQCVPGDRAARLLATLGVSAAEADFNVGDEITLQETMLGLRQGDVGEVVGVQGYMIGVVFEDHPQAVLYVDKDLISPAPEEPEEEEGSDFGPMEPQARLLAWGIDADWWDDKSHEEQKKYLQKNPGSRKKLTKKPGDPGRKWEHTLPEPSHDVPEPLVPLGKKLRAFFAQYMDGPIDDVTRGLAGQYGGHDWLLFDEGSAKPSEEELTATRQVVSSFLPAFEAVLDKLSEVTGGAEVIGRLKDAASAWESVYVRGRATSVDALHDNAGTRVTYGDRESQREGFSKLLASLPRIPEGSTEDGIIWIGDFADEARPGGYRASHAIVRIGGRKVEVQFRTTRQTYWADWNHNKVYKAPEGIAKNPKAIAYSEEVSSYLADLDAGRGPGDFPACPEVLKTMQHCFPEEVLA